MSNVKISSVPLVFDWLGFGNTITACRLEHGLTLYQLGQLCDLSASSVQDIENATHKNALMSTVLAVANIFDIDVRHYFILSDTRIRPAHKKTAQGRRKK